MNNDRFSLTDNSIGKTAAIEGGNYTFLNEIKPIVAEIRSLGGYSDPKKRRFSRLTFNVAKSYVKNKLNEIRLYGSREADKLIDRFISTPKDPYSAAIFKEIALRRSYIKRLLCDLASKCDGDAIAGFCVPFVYGGIVSSKGFAGETTKIIEFKQKNGDMDSNGLKRRVLSASNSIFRAKNNGLSVMVIRGCAREIYSPEMCRAYSDSPEQAFILIESCEEAWIEHGMATYEREVIERLRGIKNVFILIEYKKKGKRAQNGEHTWEKTSGYEAAEKYGGATYQGLAIAKLKALRCYKILTGLLIVDGSSEECSSELRECGENVCPIFDKTLSVAEFINQNGVNIADLIKEFNAKAELIKGKRRGGSFYGREGNTSSARRGASDVEDISYEFSDHLRDLLGKISLYSDKNLIFPDIYEILTVIQYISSLGRCEKTSIDKI